MQADWEFTMRINLTGTMLVTRELIPALETARGNVCEGSQLCVRHLLSCRACWPPSTWWLRGYQCRS